MSDYGLIINGNKIACDNSFPVINPANEEVLAQCPLATKEQLNDAVKAAADAFESWSKVPDEVRAAACGKIAEAINDNADELARLLTEEQGKPLSGQGSRFEVGGAGAWAGYTGSLSLPDKIIQDDEVSRVIQTRKPIGVVGSITPWNWPLMIAIWHVVPAIRAGNTVVIKPSPYTPLSTLRMVEILNDCLPPGVLNCVTGEDELGQWMSEHPGIQKIIFTGSTATGKKVMSSSAGNLKRLTLELGGNDAGIVLDDADPAAIAEGIIGGAFINNGQTCAALKRLYVHESVYDELCMKLVEAASNVPMGNGLDEENLQGPIQNRCNSTKSKDYWRTPRRTVVACFAEERFPMSRGTSCRTPWLLMSAMAHALSMKNNSVPCCRSSSIQMLMTRFDARMRRKVVWVAQSGRPIQIVQRKLLQNWSVARPGSIPMAESHQTSRSVA